MRKLLKRVLVRLIKNEQSPKETFCIHTDLKNFMFVMRHTKYKNFMLKSR